MPLQRELPSPRRSSKRTRFATSALGAGALMIGAAMVLEPASAQTGATCEINGVAIRPKPIVPQKTEIDIAKKLPGSTLARDRIAVAEFDGYDTEARFTNKSSRTVALSEAVIINGLPYLTGVEIYNTDPNIPSQYTKIDQAIPCGRFFRLPLETINQLSPAVTAGIPTPDARVVTATLVPPTATERVVVATPVPPTATERVITATPVPATATERVVVATEVPPTATAKVVTLTPTPTEHAVLATSTPRPPLIGPGVVLDFWEGVRCAAIPAALVLLGAGLIAASRMRGDGGMSGFESTRGDAETRRANTLLENLRNQLANHSNIRDWSEHERNAMYAVDVTAATAPNATKDLVGNLLAATSMEKNSLPLNQRRLITAIRDLREQFAGVHPTAKAVVDAKRESEEARQSAVLDATERTNAFDKTKNAEELRRTFIAANPDHQLTRFDAETDVALSVRGSERVWVRRGIIPWRTTRYY